MGRGKTVLSHKRLRVIGIAKQKCNFFVSNVSTLTSAILFDENAESAL